MDSGDLLAREEEFRKLNKQLEKKTNSLLKEIELSMQKQDIFSDFSRSFNSPKHLRKYNKAKNENSPKSDFNNKKINEEIKVLNTELSNTVLQKTVCDCSRNESANYNNNMHFLHAFVNISVQEKIIPPSFLKDRFNVESVCKCLSSAVKLLREQNQSLQSALDKKKTQCDLHMTKYAEIESEKLSLLNQCNKFKSESLDSKNKSLVLQNKLNEKDRLYKEQIKESDKLTNEVKKLKSKSTNAEAKCLNMEDEIRRLKQTIEGLNHSEKEFRDSSRVHSATQKTTIAKQEHKIKQLIGTIDKQHQLIDNLKTQNSILGADILLQGLEKDYSKLLLGDD